MHRAGLGRQHAAPFIERHPIVEQRQLFMAEAAAGAFETSERSLECGSDYFIEPVEQEPFGQAEAQAGQRDRLRSRELFPGHDRVRFGAIGNAARDRPN